MKHLFRAPFLAAFLTLVAFCPASFAQSSSSAAKVEAPKQQPPTPDLSGRVPPVKPDDVKSLDSILVAIYDVISGPAGDRDCEPFQLTLCP